MSTGIHEANPDGKSAMGENSENNRIFGKRRFRKAIFAGIVRIKMLSRREKIFCLSLCGVKVLFACREKGAFEVLRVRIHKDGFK
jgi:hypothetical protein